MFALSNLPSLSGPESGHLLVLSQESGKIVNIDRTGDVFNSLTILPDPGNPLSVPAQQHEGLTMDGNGFLYVVSENGGGDFDHPAAVGVRAVRGSEPGAHRPGAEQSGQHDRGEHQHRRADQGGGRRRSPTMGSERTT